jgi:hypothetical protein
LIASSVAKWQAVLTRTLPSMTEKESLQKLTLRLPDFESWPAAKQLPIIAWFLYRFCQKEVFCGADIQRCYWHLDMRQPAALPLIVSKCDALITVDGPFSYKLHWRIRDKFDKELLLSSQQIQIHQLLKDLPTKISITEEKTFLEETLKCYSYGANRAAVVMCWNLAFSHLCNFILKDTSRLTLFNQALRTQFPKKHTINAYSDFSRLQESEILDLCNASNVINKNVYKKLKGKLDDRNIAAHPSGIIFTKLDVEHYISDLINNVVLML